jgi:hypothetical protein
MPSRAPRRAAHRLVLAAAALLALAPVLAGCGTTPPGAPEGAGIVGEGDVQTEIRDLPPFTRVSVAAGMKVILGAAAQQQVRVAAQPNILPLITTEVVDGQLVVTLDAEGGIASSKPLSLTVEVPVLESVALSAGSVGYLEHTGDTLKVDVSAGAELTGIGTTPDLRLTATTGSHAKLGELVAQAAEISINDGATAEINVVGSLTGVADGGSTVILTSKPATVDVDTASGATVQGD